jgi:hypothetical protein
MLAVVFSIFVSQLIIQPAIDSVLQHWTYGGAMVSHIKVDLDRGGMSDVYALRVQDTAEIIVVTGQHVEVYQVPVTVPGQVILLLRS